MILNASVLNSGDKTIIFFIIAFGKSENVTLHKISFL